MVAIVREDLVERFNANFFHEPTGTGTVQPIRYTCAFGPGRHGLSFGVFGFPISRAAQCSK